MPDRWETPDIRGLIEALRRRREEQTVAANAGGYAVPLGGPKKLFRRTSPDGYETLSDLLRKKRKK